MWFDHLGGHDPKLITAPGKINFQIAHVNRDPVFMWTNLTAIETRAAHVLIKELSA